MIPILSQYLGRLYLRSFLGFCLSLLGLVYMIDTIELFKRAKGNDDTPDSVLFVMGLLKLPEVGQIILPFIVLFAALLMLWQLNRRYEMIVVRASGFSVWQFLTPLLVCAFALGVFQATFINPIGAVFLKRYQVMEDRYLNYESSSFAFLEDGLWMRKSLPKGDYVILNAKNVDAENWTMTDIAVYQFSKNDAFTQRIDAPQATITKDGWQLKNAVITEPSANLQDAHRSYPNIILHVDISLKDIEDSFAEPSRLPFWRLPRFIHTLEKTGFNTVRFRMQFYNLLARPFLFMAMVLIAAAVMLRPPREGRNLRFVIIGVMSGFGVFFLSSFMEALGASGQIPAILAANATAFIALSLSVTALLQMEDG
jgi:lipopolysaccharide export system permease protein